MTSLGPYTALIVRALITFLLLLGLGGIIMLLATHEIPRNNQEHVWTLLGVVGTLSTQSCMWWFGSSKADDDKSGAIVLDLEERRRANGAKAAA